MADRAAYDVAFDWEDAHGRLVGLLSNRAERGLVVDLGCGYAPHAELLEAAGFTFVGLDLNEVAVDALRQRGFDARVLDLGDLDATMRALRDAVASSTAELVAVLAIDVIEHLVEPQRLLAELSAWLTEHDQAVLGVSVPNVAHRDLAFKLLAGRWDVTPTGLLDHTHLRFFTDRSLDAAMTSAAFVEVARDDRPAERSDQWWPSGSTTVSPTSRTGTWLRALRRRADDHDVTYQFIRLFRPTGETPSSQWVTVSEPVVSVFLSVIAEPAMDDAELDALRAMLVDQTDDSWELLCAHDVGDPDDDTVALQRMIEGAAGHHVSIVAGGDVLTAGWVAQFAEAARGADGLVATMLRCPGPVDAGVERAVDPVMPELGTLDAASAMFAIPTEAVRGVRLGDTGTSMVASLIVEAAEFCGVTETGVPGVSDFRTAGLGRAELDAWLQAHDTRPALHAAGTRRRLAELDREREVADRRVAELAAAVETLQLDNAWLNAELALGPVRVVRRLMRRGRSAR